jgi:hypothetical protein
VTIFKKNHCNTYCAIHTNFLNLYSNLNP